MQLIKMMTLVSLVITINSIQAAEEAATAVEVLEKVQAVSEALKADKETTLAQFFTQADQWNPNNPWVWKDSYVFVYDCKNDKAIAHPTLTGKTILDIKDQQGQLVFGGDTGLCKAGEHKGGGWVAYKWAKPGEQEPSQKISFALAVENTDYQVSAGIYSNDQIVEGFMLRNPGEEE